MKTVELALGKTTLNLPPLWRLQLRERWYDNRDDGGALDDDRYDCDEDEGS